MFGRLLCWIGREKVTRLLVAGGRGHHGHNANPRGFGQQSFRNGFSGVLGGGAGQIIRKRKK